MELANFATVPVAELLEAGLRPDPSPPPLVLVVDDEPAIANTLSLILQQAGFAATAVHNGNDALEIARLTPPDLLLSDVLMPGISGIDLAMAFVELVPDCRILLLSGQAEALDLLTQSGIAQGRFKILAKPIDPPELLSEISSSLGQPL